MVHKDWIPAREQDFVDLAGRWKTLLSDKTNQTAYGWGATDCTTVTGKIDTFLTARNTYEAANSSPNRLAKDEAKKIVVETMRDFANTAIRYNKKMTDEDRLPLGIHPADHTPTTHSPPTSQPDTVVDNTQNHFEHQIRALNRGRNDASKPDDAYGVRYAWQVGGVRPASGEDLPKSKFSRKTTHVVTHTEADKTKIAFYATCYENTKGDPGPWSPIEEAVIG
jgi:hypothetical protein